MIKNVHLFSCKVPAIRHIFIELEFSRFSKNTRISNCKKIRPMGAELFHAEGRTDRQTDKSLFASMETRLKATTNTVVVVVSDGELCRFKDTKIYAL